MKTYETYAGNGHNLDGRDPEQIEHDLSEIRSELSDTIEAIWQRFSPGELVDRAIHSMRSVGRGSADFTSNLGRSIRDNPVPAALIGVGLAYLLYGRSGERSRSGGQEIGGRVRGALERAKDRAGELRGRAGERLSSDEGEEYGETTQRVGHAYGQAKERGREWLEEKGSELRDRGGELAERTRETGARAREKIEETWREQPLVVGALGIALGAALGATLPVGRREQEVLEPVAERAQESLGAKVREGAERAENLIESAADKASEKIESARPDEERPGTYAPIGRTPATAPASSQPGSFTGSYVRSGTTPSPGPGSAPPPGRPTRKP